MKLRIKIILVLIMFIVLLFGSNYLINSYFIMDNYRTFQNDYTTKEINRVNNGVDNLIKKHKLLLTDWSYWDDTRNYINKHNNKFVATNITDIFFIEQSINYVLIYDKDMNLLYEEGFDFNNLIHKQTPKDLIDNVKNYKNESGILEVGDEKIVFSTSGISNSKGDVKKEGLLVFCYDLTKNDIATLSKNMDVQLTLSSIYNINKNDIVKTSQDSYTNVKIYKKFSNANNGISINFKIDNDIEMLGEKSLSKTLMISLFIITLLGVFIFLITIKMIRRLEVLSKQIDKIELVEGKNYQVDVSGNDELTILCKAINSMLNKIMFMNDKLLEHATLDMMTGVLNRRAGIDKLDAIVKYANISKSNLTIAFIDINELKTVNDVYGHKAGDQYIKTIVECMSKNIRDKDLICRLGGDEFLIIFKDCKKNDANKVLKRIDADIDQLNETGSYKYDMSISKGIVPYEYGMNVSDFIELADKKMYFDKRKYKKSKKITD